MIATKWKKPTGFTECFISVMSSNPHEHSANFFSDLEGSFRKIGRGARFPTDPDRKDAASVFEKKTDHFDQAQSFK